MQHTTKTRSVRRIIRPTEEEEVAIQRGIAADPDNPEWTAADFAKARCLNRIELPTPEEDTAILRGIEVDPETFVPTDEQFAKMRRSRKGK
jgi:hypothetical protein